MPSPVEERPGLFIRDPRQYSDAQLIIPPQLVGCLQFLDGQKSELDLREHLVRATGQFEVSDITHHLVSTLSRAGFLEDDVFRQMRGTRHREFAEAPVREPTHAGAAYPVEANALHEMIGNYCAECGVSPSTDSVSAIAAPHVSPTGGWRMFGAAYNAIPAAAKDKVFVILGTSHSGELDRFGLTRKPFRTPFGDAITETSLVDRLTGRATEAIDMEDYCHASEHSIEFQVVFLQHLFGAGIRILPILVGSLGRSIYEGGKPEDTPAVAGFLDALGELSETEGDRLFWVLGVDLAHVGRRYGDPFAAIANEGRMNEVAERDAQRLDRIAEGDADGFWDLIRENQNDLHWCGADTFYTYLRAVQPGHGRRLGYEQWNIDKESVVSFAALSFGG